MRAGGLTPTLHQGPLSCSPMWHLVQGICSLTQGFWVQCGLTIFGHFSTFCFLLWGLDLSSSPKSCAFPKFPCCLPEPTIPRRGATTVPSPRSLSPSLLCLPSPSPLLSHISFPSLSSCQTTLWAHESQVPGSYCYRHFFVPLPNDAAQSNHRNVGQEWAC